MSDKELASAHEVLLANAVDNFHAGLEFLHADNCNATQRGNANQSDKCSTSSTPR
jgi:hypothetical protein